MKPSDSTPAYTRRRFIEATGATGALLASGNLLAACGVNKSTGGGGSGTIKIGLVTPQTGPAASFGEVDPYIVNLVKAATAGGITAKNGKKYSIQILERDSQDNPQQAAKVANDLISSSGVDLMLASSTPETVNPVSSACEAAGIPCISTVVPWQAWYFGRGAKPTQKKAFKFTYHFSFGVEDFAKSYFPSWHAIKTNKVVGLLYPNDADGNALRAALPGLMKKAGFTVVDTGPYNDGLNDFSAQIAKLKAANAQIFNTFPLPPDFATFWKQAAQQGYKPIIPQIAKTGLFPSQVDALGSLGDGLVTAAFWHPTFPYSSSLLGKTSQQLADGYQKTGKQWTQMVGSTAALFDVAIGALKNAPNPKDKLGLANSIPTLKVDTPVGSLDFGAGPVGNVVTTPLINGQWVKGTTYPLDLVIVNNADDPKVPIAAKLRPF